VITPTPATTSQGLWPSELERSREVVGKEQRRQRDHDQVVQEERPAGQEADQVVERPPDERGGAAHLRDRRRSLGVRHRHEQEEHADGEEHRGREAEGVEGDDAEREVDRRGDLAVRDREE
jgi:hypothetical protein